MPFRILPFINFVLLSSAGICQSNLISLERYVEGKPQSRATFQYDAQGRETGIKIYLHTSNDTWAPRSSEERKFDDDGREIFYSNSFWENSYDSLLSRLEIHRVYNNVGKILKENTDLFFRSTGKSKNEVSYIYNGAGCLTSVSSRSDFEGIGGPSFYEYAEVYEVDEQCRPLKKTSGTQVTIWKYAQGNSYSKKLYQVNGTDSLLVSQEQYVNNLITESIYPGLARNTYAYNTNGEPTELNRFEWIDSVWVLTSKSIYIYTYNNLNLLTQLETSFMFKWEANSITGSISGHGITTYEYHEWDKIKYTESHTTYSDGTDIHFSNRIDFRCDGSPLTKIETDMTTNTVRVKSFYYYSAAAGCEPPSARISLFPNPTSRFLNITTVEPLLNTTLKIYNPSGQLLSEIIDTKNMFPIQIDLNHLVPGVYLLKLESPEIQFTELFVKQ